MLIASSAASMSSAIASSGNRFAALKAASAFDSPRARVCESLNGLTQAHFVDGLIKKPVETITEELDELRKHLLNSSNGYKAALIHSNDDLDMEMYMKTRINSFFPSSINPESSKEEGKEEEKAAASDRNLLFVPGPFSSNFTAMSLMPFVKNRPSARESAILTLTAGLLRSKHLHREIREKGGAYGSAASFSSLSGMFTFSSYRDPSPLNSLNVFRNAGKALLTRDAPSEEDLLGAKLSAFSDLDSPVDISSRGLQEFLYGPEYGSDSRRQEYRDALRSCSLKNISEAIEGTLLPLIEESSKICVIGEDAKIKDFIKNDLKIKWSISKKLIS